MTQIYEEYEQITFAKQKDILGNIHIKNPVVFDIGANVGQSVLQYKRIFPLATIHSFEANPEVMSELINAVSSFANVHLHNVALSDSLGKAQFFVTSVAEASSMLRPQQRLMSLSKENKYAFRKIVVPSITLDSFCEQQDIGMIDILKIDVQGAEMKVLHGAKNMLKASCIKVIYIEVTMAPSYVGQMELSELLVFLEECGYQLWDMLPFLYTQAGRAWTANAIFIQNDIVDQLEEYKCNG